MSIEVELGFTAEQTAPRWSAASTATCRRCSPTPKCIECDACIDICPVDCLTITKDGEEPTCASACWRRPSTPNQTLFVSTRSSRRAA
jgi:formate dehydrogenase beta subunit